MHHVPYPHLAGYFLGVIERVKIVAHIVFYDEFDKNNLVDEDEIERLTAMDRKYSRWRNYYNGDIEDLE